MARLPKYGDVKAIQESVSDIANKLDQIASFKDAFNFDPKPLDDISAAVEKIAWVMGEKWGKAIGNTLRAHKDIEKQIEKEKKTAEQMEKVWTELAKKAKERTKEIEDLKEIEKEILKNQKST